MQKIKEIILKSATAWVAIGTLLIVLATQGVSIPEWLPEIFSQVFVDQLLLVLGSVINFSQFIRSIFVAVDKGGDEAEVQVLSATQVRKIYYNPFKIAA